MEQTPWLAYLITSLALLFVLRGIARKASEEKTVEWPAGPRRLPVIGNLHQLAGRDHLLHHTLAKLAQVYGRAMTVWVGGWRPMIVVSDAELAWEVLVSKSSDYANRVQPYAPSPKDEYWTTVATADAGTHWHALRRGLQGGPLGPVNLSAQFHFQEQDVELIVKTMKEQAVGSTRGVIEPLNLIRLATIRLLSRLCFGAEFDDDSFVDKVDGMLEASINITGHGRLVDAFPYALFIPSVFCTFMEGLSVKRKIEEVIGPMLSRPAPSNSYLHFLLSRNIPEHIRMMAIFEVFLLAIDSTSSTATWALAFLIHNQDVQERLYQEIAEYAKDQTVVRAEDVGKLPYLQAVTKETMRMKPIAPLAVPHKTAKDTSLDGMRVKKGTEVVVNLYAVHYDPKVWFAPHQFQPDRFLAEVETGKGELQAFLPFGGGMRACAGMELGKLQVALVVANLVKAFKWLPEVEGQLPDLSEEMTSVLKIKKPLAARIVPRVA